MENNAELKCTCANCGALIEYHTDASGEVVECPNCHRKSRLPAQMPPNAVQPESLPQPLAPPRLCPACGEYMAPYGSTCDSCDSKRRRTLRLFVGILSAVAVLAVGWLFLKRFYNTASPPTPTYPAHATLAPPRVKTPKSMKDFRISAFSLEFQRGSTTVVAVADIQNASLNLYGHVRVEAELLDARGVKIGSVNAEVNELRPNATWRFIAQVKDPRAKSARFVSLKEIQ